MRPEIIELIRYRKERSTEALEMARLAIENGYLRDAVNRLYYTCFYAVTALLLTKDMSSSKHRGVQSLFDQHWVLVGHVPREWGRFYHNLLKHRQKGDYEDLVVFEREDVAEWLREAERFHDALFSQVEAFVQEQSDQR